ncbi:glycoside hydrolase family 15 protein [Jonesiaceae bacterium BS-20]|uniref:Glycoside hydrolase family 15 protein n=1 Tax=Jonesiaceae bacterium BS-20 TaxID=3120821 RepID=A0AAU7DX96_9MICO
MKAMNPAQVALQELQNHGVSKQRIDFLIAHSHSVITTFQEPNGALPASPTFSAYKGYAWLRDGAFTSEGLSRFGDVVNVNRYHDWVSGVLTARRGQVDELIAKNRRGEEVPVSEMLPTRFTFEGMDGSDPWWDFQTDGYGMWIWAATTHATRHGVDLAKWRTGLEVAFDFAAEFWERNCYDWWEEHIDQTHGSTLGALFAGFEAIGNGGVLDTARSARAQELAKAVQTYLLENAVTTGRATDPIAPHLAKWVGNPAVDASLAACITPFHAISGESELAVNTIDAIERDLSFNFGVHRFAADVFFGGGQWLLLSCLVGWNKAAAGDIKGAAAYFAWVTQQALENGDMPEQVPGHLLHADHQQRWIDKWGTVATPLLWSHGMFLILADELGLISKEN